MVKINPFEKDSGFKEVTKMKHKSMGRDREDEFERDKKYRRWALLTCIISTFVWFAAYMFLQSMPDGDWIKIARVAVKYLFAVPIASGMYSIFMDIKIRAKEKKLME